MSFRRRAYTEVLDNLLTNIVGGVSAESHGFPPGQATEPPYNHALQQPPARDIVSVYGLRNGQSQLFKKDADYKLADDKQTLTWLSGGQLPDKGSVFTVNYLQGPSTGSINDLHVGSVVRTLCESVGLEMARMYAQLEKVYESAFIDTATGRSLDNVVALLGTDRIRAGRFSGEVEFTRVSGTHGAITIPAGTRIMTSDGNIEYETTVSVTLADGQNTIRVTSRDVEENTQGLQAGELNVLGKPIAGIAGVTNPVPTEISSNDESDEQLRTRAKNFLHGSERATLGSIKEAVTRQGIQVEVVETAPGKVEIIPHVSQPLPPELVERVKKAIEDVRPAGVDVSLNNAIEPPTRVNLAIRIQTSPDLLEEDLRSVQDLLQSKIKDYFDSLPIEQPGSVNKLIGLVLGIAEIEDMEIIEATTGESTSPTPIPDADLNKGQLGIADKTTVLGDLDIVDPNLPTVLTIIVAYNPADIPAAIAAPPDPTAIEHDINTMLTSLNAMNTEETVSDPAKRELVLGKLLYVLPLAMAGTTKPYGPIEDVWTGTLPAGLAAADVEPFSIKFVFTKENGLSQTVMADANSYTLNAFERLTLGSVEIVETDDG